ALLVEHRFSGAFWHTQERQMTVRFAELPQRLKAGSWRRSCNAGLKRCSTSAPPLPRARASEQSSGRGGFIFPVVAYFCVKQIIVFLSDGYFRKLRVQFLA